jgi:hypothetical protein
LKWVIWGFPMRLTIGSPTAANCMSPPGILYGFTALRLFGFRLFSNKTHTCFHVLNPSRCGKRTHSHNPNPKMRNLPELVRRGGRLFSQTRVSLFAKSKYR